jgi:hypothetical protein
MFISLIFLFCPFFPQVFSLHSIHSSQIQCHQKTLKTADGVRFSVQLFGFNFSPFFFLNVTYSFLDQI